MHFRECNTGLGQKKDRVISLLGEVAVTGELCRIERVRYNRIRSQFARVTSKKLAGCLLCNSSEEEKFLLLAYFGLHS